MKKVLIIDDEPFIAKGVEQKIEWNTYGCVVCGVANDGIDGKNKIINTDPDIIICDILMPGQTGLDLCKFLYENKYRAKVILLTAYSEFSYIKEALKYGISDYLLKPLDMKEFNNAIIKTINSIDEKNREQKVNTFANKSLLFNIVLNYSDECENLFDLKVRTGTILTIKVSSDDDEKGEKILYYSIKNLVESFFLEKNIKGEFKIHGNEIIAILYFENFIISVAKKRMEDFSIQLVETIQERINKKVLIGIGTFFKNMDEINVSYKNSLTALEQNFFHPTQNVFLFVAKNNENKKMIDFNILDFYYNILEQNHTYLKTEVDSLFKCFAETYEKEEIINYIKDTMKILNTYLNNGQNFSDSTYEPPLFIDLYTLDNLKLYFLSFIKHLCKITNDNFQNDSTVNRIIQIINNRYHDKNLSLNCIANELNLTVSHISRIFKKQTSQNFIDFLTDVRIEKSKILLKHTNKKPSEISNLVGYYDCRYFSQVFKKKIGKSTKEYRKSEKI